MSRFGHDALRHYAILLGDVEEEIPNAAVAHGILEVEFHVAVGHFTVGRGDGIGQEQVALFKDVPKIVVVV